jgi:hypothetical protein
MLQAKTRERDMENSFLFSPSKDLRGISAPQRCDEICHAMAGLLMPSPPVPEYRWCMMLMCFCTNEEEICE